MHKEMMDSEVFIMHKRMLGVKMLILGVLILANIFFFGLNWPVFIGAVLILAGFGSLIMPCCHSRHHRRR